MDTNIADRVLDDTVAYDAAMRARPGGGWRQGDDVWLFAYGSLIWSPEATVMERRVAEAPGWRRRFCLNDAKGRGSLVAPALMLALEPGPTCPGLALRVPGEVVADDLPKVWRREMSCGGYRPAWLTLAMDGAEQVALAFVADPGHPDFVPELALAEEAGRIARAVGPGGSNADYLYETVRSLAEAGIPDPGLERLEAAVRRLG